MDTDKVCGQCGKQCVPAQSYCPKCGSMLPSATPVVPDSAPTCRPHKLIVNKGAEEQIIECEDEEQAFNKAVPWLTKGYIARIVDEHGIVKWTQVPSNGQIAVFTDDATERRSETGAQATTSPPIASPKKPWWQFW